MSRVSGSKALATCPVRPSRGWKFSRSHKSLIRLRSREFGGWGNLSQLHCVPQLFLNTVSSAECNNPGRCHYHGVTPHFMKGCTCSAVMWHIPAQSFTLPPPACHLPSMHPGATKSPNNQFIFTWASVSLQGPVLTHMSIACTFISGHGLALAL